MSDFKLVPTPEQADTAYLEQLDKIMGNDFSLPRATAAAMDRLAEAMRPETVVETMFSTTQRHDDFDFEPAGDGGWYCTSKSYTGPPDPIGHGPTQKDALIHYLDQLDEPAPNVVYPKIFGGSSAEPADYGAPRRVPDPDED